MKVSIRISWAALVGIPVLVVLAAWVGGGSAAALSVVAILMGVAAVAGFSIALAVIIWNWIDH